MYACSFLPPGRLGTVKPVGGIIGISLKVGILWGFLIFESECIGISVVVKI
jgi:hypothetical protein